MRLGFLHSFLLTPSLPFPHHTLKIYMIPFKLRPQPLQFVEDVPPTDWYVQMPRIIFKKVHIFRVPTVS